MAGGQAGAAAEWLLQREINPTLHTQAPSASNPSLAHLWLTPTARKWN